MRSKCLKEEDLIDSIKVIVPDEITGIIKKSHSTMIF